MGLAKRMKVVDLFSGAGGASAGFARLRDRFEIIGAVDLEQGKPGLGRSAGTSTFCNPTFKRNIHVTPKTADLAVLEPHVYRNELGLEPGELDVLISCAPCTGFSQKNARNHLEDDPRNALVERTGDFVAEFLPHYLVMENVKELLSGNQRHHFINLRKYLEDIGYSIWAEVRDLSEYGVPQRRVRALIIAFRDDVAIGLPRALTKPRTVRDAIGHLPQVSAGEQHPSDPMHVSPRLTPPVLDRIKAIPKDGGSWADVMNDPRLTPAEKRYLLIPRMLRARPGSFPDVYGRLWWDRPAVTITRECGHVGNGRYVHPEQDRLLTVREMALLQGFPPDYVFEGPLSAKYNQIGDAVPPIVAECVAQHIAAVESGAVATTDTPAATQLQFFERPDAASTRRRNTPRSAKVAPPHALEDKP
jgi:DNA (cytosine-5)-methyltransferase 1